MKTISKSRLKAKMLEVFREVEKDGEELIVTDNNRPVLRILPFRNKSSVHALFGPSQGRVRYHEDIDAPTSEEWPLK